MSTLVTTIKGIEDKTGSVFFEYESRTPIPELPGIPFPPPFGFTVPSIPTIPGLDAPDFSADFGAGQAEKLGLDVSVPTPTMPTPSLPGIPFPPPLGITIPSVPTLPTYDAPDFSADFGADVAADLGLDGAIPSVTMPTPALPGIPFPPPLLITLPSIPTIPIDQGPDIPGITKEIETRVE